MPNISCWLNKASSQVNRKLCQNYAIGQTKTDYFLCDNEDCSEENATFSEARLQMTLTKCIYPADMSLKMTITPSQLWGQYSVLSSTWKEAKGTWNLFRASTEHQWSSYQRSLSEYMLQFCFILVDTQIRTLSVVHEWCINSHSTWSKS